MPRIAEKRGFQMEILVEVGQRNNDIWEIPDKGTHIKELLTKPCDGGILMNKFID